LPIRRGDFFLPTANVVEYNARKSCGVIKYYNKSKRVTSSSSIVSVSHRLMDKKAPVCSVCPQFLYFDYLPALLSLLDVFQYLNKPSIFCSSYGILSLKF
jgi:hypothetical protein